MDHWVLWLIAAVIFGVGEIATLGFFLAPFAGGALVAALVAACRRRERRFSLVVFLLVSVALLAALRPIARSHTRDAARSCAPARRRSSAAARWSPSGSTTTRARAA